MTIDEEWGLWRCDSIMHDCCHGSESDAWTCSGCNGRFCYNEGCDDALYALCDACWANETIATKK